MCPLRACASISTSGPRTWHRAQHAVWSCPACGAAPSTRLEAPLSACCLALSRGLAWQPPVECPAEGDKAQQGRCSPAHRLLRHKVQLGVQQHNLEGVRGREEGQRCAAVARGHADDLRPGRGPYVDIWAEGGSVPPATLVPRTASASWPLHWRPALLARRRPPSHPALDGVEANAAQSHAIAGAHREDTADRWGGEAALCSVSACEHMAQPARGAGAQRPASTQPLTSRRAGGRAARRRGPRGSQTRSWSWLGPAGGRAVVWRRAAVAAGHGLPASPWPSQTLAAHAPGGRQGAACRPARPGLTARPGRTCEGQLPTVSWKTWASPMAGAGHAWGLRERADAFCSGELDAAVLISAPSGSAEAQRKSGCAQMGSGAPFKFVPDPFPPRLSLLTKRANFSRLN